MRTLKLSMFNNRMIRSKLFWMVLSVVCALWFYMRDLWPFLSSDLSLIRNGDTIDAFYPAYIYCRDQILSGKLSLFSWEAGFGSSTMTIFHMNTLTDPYFYPTLILSEKAVNVWYEWSAVLKGGVAAVLSYEFLYLYLEDGANDSKEVARGVIALLGAIVYSTSGWFISQNYVYPLFASYYSLFPLALIGTYQYIIHDRKHAVLILSTALLPVMNYYFFYQTTIAMYALVLFECISRRITIKKAVCFIVPYAIGVSMSMFYFIPNVYGLLNSARISDGNGIFEYLEWFSVNTIFRNISLADNSIYLGVTMIVIMFGFASPILVSGKKRVRDILIAISVLVGLSTPYVNYLMNGFTYPERRWYYILGILLVMLSVDSLYSLFDDEKKESRIILIFMIVSVYAIKRIGDGVRLSDSLLYCMYVLVLIYVYLSVEKKKLVLVLATAILFMNITSNVTYISKYNIEKYNYYTNEQVANEMFNDGSIGAVETINRQDGSQFRIQKTYNSVSSNDAYIQKYCGFDIYNSLVDADYKNMMVDEYNVPLKGLFFNLGDVVDNRPYIETLYGNKYYLSNKEDTPQYGYEFNEEVDGVYIYENKYNLPLTFFYDKWFPKNEYLSTDFAVRDQITGKAAVVEKTPFEMDRLSESDLNYEIYDLNSTILDFGESNHQWNDGVAEFDFEESTQVKVRRTQRISESGFYYLEFDIERDNVKDKFQVAAITQNGTNISSMYERAHNSKAFYPQDKVTLYLGYYDAGYDQFYLKFPESKGRISNARIVRLSEESYKSDMAHLSDLAPENVKISGSRVEYTLSADNSGIAVLSTSFDKGWKIRVNNRTVEPIKVNGGVLGFFINGGKNEVELHYRPEGLDLGILISILGFGMYLMLYTDFMKKMVEMSRRMRKNLSTK